MYKEAKRPAWAEINLMNLEHNIKCVRDKVGPNKEIFGIIKADGYGHGAFETSEVLKENGVTSFGVATLHEAISLREKGVTGEIITLGLTPSMYASEIVKYDFTPVVGLYENALAISEEAKKAGKTVHGLVAVDTGMGRIGLRPSEQDAISEVKKISQLENFKIKGLMSHFSTADAADKSYAEEQAKKFAEFHEEVKKAGIDISFCTLANSAAIMEMPNTYYDAVRPGIMLYGQYPSDEVDRTQMLLKPVMSVKANIVHLKKVAAGESVSYARSFIAERESLIATLTLGYADGFPRPYSRAAKVIINGAFAPIAGNICMDQCMVDVTDVPNVKAGDEVIIMGSDGKNTISAEDIATATGTINYEIVCAFGQRLPKVYIK